MNRPTTLFPLLLALLAVLVTWPLQPAAAQPDSDPGNDSADNAATADADADGDDTGDGDTGADSGTGEAGTDAADGDEPPVSEMTREQLEARLAAQDETILALRQQLAEAQEITPEEETAPRGAKLKAGINFSAIITAGNSDSITLDGGFSLALEDPYLFELGTYLTYQYIETENATQQHKLWHTIAFDYLPNDVISPFMFVNNGFEEARKITWHFDVGAGVKWTLFRDPWDPLEYDKSPQHSYSISLAILLDHDQFQPNADTDHETFVRLSLWVKGKQRLADDFYISDKFEFYPAIDDFDNWLLKNTFALELTIEKKYRVSFSWRFQQDSQPAAGVEQVDQEFKVSLHIKIK